MTPSYLLSRVVAPSIPLFLTVLAIAQSEPNKASSQFESLASLTAQLEKADATRATKIEAFGKILDAEEKEGRVKDSVARSIRWTLRNVGAASSDTPLPASRIPADNEKLTAAYTDLESTLTAGQAERTAALNASTKEVKRLIAALMSAEKPTTGEIDALIDAIQTFRDKLQKRPGAAFEIQNNLTSATNSLRSFRRVVDAQANAELPKLGQALVEFRGAYNEGWENERRNYIDKVFKPYRTAVDAARNGVDEAITAGKPASELNDPMARYNEAAAKLSELQVPGLGERSVNQDVQAYRALIRALGAIETGSTEGGLEQFSSALNQFENSTSGRSTEVVRYLDGYEAKALAQAKKRAEADVENVRAKLKGVKTPADLRALIDDVQALVAGRNRRQLGRVNFEELSRQLSSLYVTWNTGSLQSYRGVRADENGASGEFGPALEELRKTIERQVLVRILNIPELNQPPLADLPAAPAIEELRSQLAEKRDWRRLYELIEAQSGGGSGYESYGADRLVGGRDRDAYNALRSYFTAQNFELAEQWSDAAECYRTVLRTPSKLAPLSEAAERLKDLINKHPEIVKSAATAKGEIRN